MNQEIVELVQILVLVIAAASIVAGFLFWRKSTITQELLLETKNRFEDLQSKLIHTEEFLAKANEKSNQKKEHIQRIEKIHESTKQKSTQIIEQLEAKEQELTQLSEKFERQNEHLSAQVATLTSQLKETEQAKREMQIRSERLQKELEGRISEAKNDLEPKLRELRTENSELGRVKQKLEAEKESLERKFREVDPEIVKRAKRKVAQFDRLYSSMKGLREMAEERNSNWEVALRKFAVWILQNGHQVVPGAKPRKQLPEKIGPLVGEALELIGAQLIDESIVGSDLEETVSEQINQDNHLNENSSQPPSNL